MSNLPRSREDLLKVPSFLVPRCGRPVLSEFNVFREGAELGMHTWVTHPCCLLRYVTIIWRLLYLLFVRASDGLGSTAFEYAELRYTTGMFRELNFMATYYLSCGLCTPCRVRAVLLLDRLQSFLPPRSIVDWRNDGLAFVSLDIRRADPTRLGVAAGHLAAFLGALQFTNVSASWRPLRLSPSLVFSDPLVRAGTQLRYHLAQLCERKLVPHIYSARVMFSRVIPTEQRDLLAGIRDLVSLSSTLRRMGCSSEVPMRMRNFGNARATLRRSEVERVVPASQDDEETVRGSDVDEQSMSLPPWLFRQGRRDVSPGGASLSRTMQNSPPPFLNQRRHSRRGGRRGRRSTAPPKRKLPKSAGAVCRGRKKGVKVRKQQNRR